MTEKEFSQMIQQHPLEAQWQKSKSLCWITIDQTPKYTNPDLWPPVLLYRIPIAPLGKLWSQQ